MTSTLAPYSMATDNVIMSLFIANIIGMSYVILMNGASIVERLKSLVYYHHKSMPFNDRTHITRICNALMYGQTVFYMAIITMTEMEEYTSHAIEKSPLVFLAAYSAAFILFFVLKRFAYDTVNSILYTKKEMLEWRNLYFFTVKLLGFALSPAIIAILFINSSKKGLVNYIV